MDKELKQKIDLKTKPLGALGDLERLAHQVGMIQNTLTPSLENPAIVVFCGDHGIANEGVSAYPQEVTYQMVFNFLNKGAAINVFSEQHGFDLSVVDAGVNYDFDLNQPVIHQKVAHGTQSFLKGAAMTPEQFDDAVTKGRQVVKKLAEKGTNIIGFGEMGIGNTSSSTMLMSYLCQLPIEDCVGKGTGVVNEQFNKKLKVLQQAKKFHGDLDQVHEVLRTFGGFEMVQMYGAFLQAYEEGMTILVDGFIASAVFLAAYKVKPAIKNNAIFCHLSDEKGHQTLLGYLDAKPILKLSLRLGEGTGCALAYPIVQSAVNFLNNMASFESAGVSDKD